MLITIYNFFKNKKTETICFGFKVFFFYFKDLESPILDPDELHLDFLRYLYLHQKLLYISLHFHNNALQSSLMYRHFLRCDLQILLCLQQKYLQLYRSDYHHQFLLFYPKLNFFRTDFLRFQQHVKFHLPLLHCHF